MSNANHERKLDALKVAVLAIGETIARRRDNMEEVPLSQLIAEYATTMPSVTADDVQEILTTPLATVFDISTEGTAP